MGKMISRYLLGLSLLASVAGAQAADNLVSNGTFSAGITGWGHGTGVPSTPGSGATLDDGNWIYQTLMLDFGQTYQLSFSFSGDGVVELYDHAFDLCFGSACTATKSLLAESLVTRTYTFTVPSSTGAPYEWTKLGFEAQGGPLSINNISVASITAVPEPESYALMLAGMGVLGFVGRRRMKQV